MAEQTNSTKVLSFAGRGLDQNEFVRRAKSKAIEWMQYQGLQGDEQTDFMNALEDRLAGITNGSYGVTDSGQISGAPDSETQYYKKRNGLRTDPAKGPGRRRVGFDPNGNVEIFLNGIAGAMPEHKVEDTNSKKSSNKKTWDSATSMGSYISNSIFGEGNPFSEEQVNLWANAHDPYIEGQARSIAGRTKFINTELLNYKNALLNGEYDITDEARNAEISKIDRLTQGGIQDWELGKLAPWMTHLLFTDDKYYSSPEERDRVITERKNTVEQEDRLNKAEAYLRGDEGSINPYEPNSKEFEALEQKRREAADKAFDNDFSNHKWNYNDDGKTFRTIITDFDGNMFQNWNINNVRDYLLGAEGLTTNDSGQDVNANKRFYNLELGHNDYTGWEKGDQTLEYSGLKDYFDALPNDFRPDDTTTIGLGYGKNNFNARSNKALLGKAAMDYARAAAANTGKSFRLSSGEYVLPEFIDWESGKAYKFSFNGNKGSVSTVNIGSILNGMDKDSEIYKNLLNEWRAYNKKPAYKNGGILKAATGAPLSSKEIEFLKSSVPEETLDPRYNQSFVANTGNRFANPEASYIEEQERYANAVEKGAEKQYREDLQNSTNFKTSDYIRLATAAADITGAVLSLSGVGSTAGAVVGAGSTLTQFGLDIADRSISVGDALKGLGIGLAMDAFTLIPEAGATAGIAKAAKTVTKLAGPILMSMQLMGNADGAIETLGKITSGHYKDITVGEWREFTKALNAITNGTTMGKTAFDRRLGKFKGLNATDKEFTLGYKKADGTTGKFKINQSDIDAVNKAGKVGGNESALTELNARAKFEGEGEALADLKGLADFSNEGRLAGFKNTKLKPAGQGIDVLTEEAAARRAVLDNENAINRRNLTGFRKVIADKFGTDYENATGGQKAFLARQAERRNNEAEELARVSEINNKLRAEALNSYKGRTFRDDEEIAAIEAELKAVNEAKQAAQAALGAPERAAVGTPGTPGYVEPVKATGAYAKQQQAMDAFNTAKAKPYDPTERASLEKTKSLAEARKARAQSKIDTSLTEAPSTQTLDEATTQLAEINTKVSNLQSEIVSFKAAHPTPTSAQKAQLTKKTNALNKLLEEQTRQQETVNRETTLYNENQQRWTLSEKARKQSEKAVKQITKADARLQEITEQENSYNAARNAAQKAQKELQESLRTKEATKQASSNKYNEVKTRLDNLKNNNRTKISDVSDSKYQTLVESTLETKIEGSNTSITNQKVANFRKFLEDINGRKNMSESKIMELLRDKEFMTKAKEAYHFKSGGVISPLQGVNTAFFAEGGSIPKFNDGDAIEPIVTTPQSLTSFKGAFGSTNVNGLTGNFNSPQTSSTDNKENPESPENPDSTSTYNPAKVDYTMFSGLYGPTNNRKYYVNPTDLAITGLENGKYSTAFNANQKIFNLTGLEKPYFVSPFIAHLRQWSTKYLEDAAQNLRTTANAQGAFAASNTNDLSQGFVFKKNAWESGNNSAKPYDFQAGVERRANVDKVTAQATANDKSRFDVGESNRQAAVAYDNYRIRALMSLLSKNADLRVKDMTAQQYGLAKNGIAQDERDYYWNLNNDPAVKAAKAAYEELVNKRYTGSEWTEEDEAATTKALYAYNKAQSDFADKYKSSRIMTTGTPYSGYGYVSNYQRSKPAFDFGSGFNGGFNFGFYGKSGGKMEAAEVEKTRRQYEKIYHDSMKLMTQISERRQRAQGGAYAYYRKLFMQSK